MLTKFPLDKEKLIPWDEFQEVCVCYANRRLLNGNWQGYVVIGLIKHGSMKTMYGRWHTDGIFNYRNVITIDYTYELYEEIMKKCPLGIVDLRDTPEYAIK